MLRLSADDNARVILTKLEDDPHSDYINASFIDVSVLLSTRPRLKLPT